MNRESPTSNRYEPRLSGPVATILPLAPQMTQNVITVNFWLFQRMSGSPDTSFRRTPTWWPASATSTTTRTSGRTRNGLIRIASWTVPENSFRRNPVFYRFRSGRDSVSASRSLRKNYFSSFPDSCRSSSSGLRRPDPNRTFHSRTTTTTWVLFGSQSSFWSISRLEIKVLNFKNYIQLMFDFF